MLEYIISLDKQLFELINGQWTAPWADVFFPFITDLNKTTFFKTVLPILLIALFCWRRGIKKGLTIFAFVLITSSLADGIGNHGFKKTVQRPRPANTENLEVTVRSGFGGYSFVSNHAANMFSTATFIGIMFPLSRIPLLLLAFLVAYSRVYNGVHFPTDVIVGGLLGVLVALATSRICQRLLKKMDLKLQGSDKTFKN